MSQGSLINRALEQGRGILRLAPNWVPRSFCIPGRRIKLHPDDYYALGGERGGIDERWFSSTTPADNGPLTGEIEGLSEVVFEDEALTHEQLGSRLQQVLEDSERKVVVLRADTGTPHGKVVTVIDLIKAAGAEALTVATRAKAQP